MGRQHQYLATKKYPNKCKKIRIGTRDKPDRQYNLEDSCTLLARTIQEKDIEVIINSKLSFEYHIAAPINNANSIIGIISRIFEYKDEKNDVVVCNFQPSSSLFKILQVYEVQFSYRLDRSVP